MLRETKQKNYITQNGISLFVSPLSNLEVFSFNFDIPNVEVPKFFIESQNRWVENPDDPRYHDAKIILENSKSLYAFDFFIQKAVTIEDTSLLHGEEWKEFYKILLRSEEDLFESTNEQFIFIKYFALESVIDQTNIINLSCLTESQVYNIYKTITIKRFDTDVHLLDVKNAIDTGITYSNIIIGYEQLVNPLDEYTACIAAHMDWSKWIRCEYTLLEKASTIALFRLDKLKTMHVEDEQQIQMEKKNK